LKGKIAMKTIKKVKDNAHAYICLLILSAGSIGYINEVAQKNNTKITLVLGLIATYFAIQQVVKKIK
jgi:hypothetical protein